MKKYRITVTMDGELGTFLPAGGGVMRATLNTGAIQSFIVEELNTVDGCERATILQDFDVNRGAVRNPVIAEGEEE